ncbi:MAG: hypothetical protein NZM11_07730 [Anaerolineales bacterium]|nr:hypothetical protein [Anaerolineales bacterium]
MPEELDRDHAGRWRRHRRADGGDVPRRGLFARAGLSLSASLVKQASAQLVANSAWMSATAIVVVIVAAIWLARRPVPAHAG